MGSSFMAMANFQEALDLYLPTQAGKIVGIDSPDILEICCYNPEIAETVEIAETELRIWISRHDDYCSVLDEDPLTVKIHESIREGGR